MVLIGTAHFDYADFNFCLILNLGESVIFEPGYPCMCEFYQIKAESVLLIIHTLRVHHVHAATNLNSGYSKYAKVARMHYFCTIALRTSRAVLTRA